jgi:hypothetical protein
MIARLVLMVQPRHDEAMTAFLLFVGIALAIGLLSLRYGVDSRTGKRQL